METDLQRGVVTNLQERRALMRRKQETLRKRFLRQQKKLNDIKKELSHIDTSIRRYNLKEDAGMIRSEVRDMIRKLACQGVSAERITEIVKIVGIALGVEVVGSVSAHSVARIMLEGLVQAQMQIAQELDRSNYFTICGDGTTIKNVQHEAKKLKTMTVDEQLYELTKYLDNATSTVDNWRTLPPDQQAVIMHDAWLALAAEIGEAEFRRLGSEEQLDIDFLAWAGCCMHKELNAVKGGASQMANAWENLGLKPPTPLLNKYETTGIAKARSEQPTRGGIKLASLAGALFNNKDDKKGHQSSHTIGYSSRFPATSNTRYGSYCDAAMVLILHLDKYVELVRIICYAKSAPGFNNIELNVLNGLQDIPTLTELVVLALYAQAIGLPYIKFVRSAHLNALTLGPFHEQVKRHCQAIISNPNLLIGLGASAATGALDGRPWDRPDVVYNILSLTPILPDIQPILVAFFQGALKTWERFTSEFKTDGVVNQASETQRQSAWIPATNDLSEGALGQCRQMLRRAPTMSDNQRNARAMWPHNNTHNWAKQNLTKEDEAYIRSEARNIDESGDNKKLRAEMNAALAREERAEVGKARQAKSMARQEATKSKLAGIVLKDNATYNELLKMKVSELDLQIDKLREAGDKSVRPKSTLRNKDAKIKEILGGLARRKEVESTERNDNEPPEYMETEDLEHGLPEDVELFHPDEVIF
ncbi:Eukaryotic translation initiation factor 3 subunit A [Rhizoctonia solani]|uniref:Eukaryotic translation initiation factor 3 subunit A n=1 Tax=Rhizoctonia solani TaxID=456999 RepID=A0A0K6FMU2_9AGAM|nr:Eukaryotic translation initiation factor 3 subunit A [Rhizoctonia solani]